MLDLMIQAIRHHGAPKVLYLDNGSTYRGHDGQLRDIDRVATACLRLAAQRKLKTVDRELLQDVVDTDSSPD